MLEQCGLCQERLSYSRWHQQDVPKQQVLYAAKAYQGEGVVSFISFVTDFSEPVIYAGRAEDVIRQPLFTDYQDNCCQMNPYLAPDLTMYAYCDGGAAISVPPTFSDSAA